MLRLFPHGDFSALFSSILRVLQQYVFAGGPTRFTRARIKIRLSGYFPLGYSRKNQNSRRACLSPFLRGDRYTLLAGANHDLPGGTVVDRMSRQGATSTHRECVLLQGRKRLGLLGNLLIYRQA